MGYVGFWAIFTGVLEISAAVRLLGKSRVKSGLPSVDCSRLSLCYRLVDIFYPSGRVIRGRRLLLGFHAAVYGVTLLFLSWSLAKRAWGKSVPNQNLWI